MASACLILASCSFKAPERSVYQSALDYYSQMYKKHSVDSLSTDCGVAQRYSITNPVFEKYASHPLSYVPSVLYPPSLLVLFAADVVSANSLYIQYGADEKARAFRWGDPPRCSGALPDRRDVVDEPLGLDVECLHPSEFESFLRLSAPAVESRIEGVWPASEGVQIAVKYDFPGITARVDFGHGTMTVGPGESLRACLVNQTDKEIRSTTDPGFATACVQLWRTRGGAENIARSSAHYWPCRGWLQTAGQ